MRIPILLLVLTLSSSPSAGADFVIDTREDWQRWSYQAGLVEITGDGHVMPGATRRHTNVSTRLGAILEAGTNARAAAAVLDGDAGTSWGPAPGDPLQQWWVAIDLGRVAAVTRLRLVFDERAEPFRLFKIFGSSGGKTFGGQILQYVLLRETTLPNKEYAVEYVFAEEPIRYIRFAASEESSNPRLSEIEVESIGDDAASGALQRGGKVVVSIEQQVPQSNSIDGNVITRWSPLTIERRDILESLVLDLGAVFWIDRVRIIEGDETRRITGASYLAEVSDGTKAPDGSLRWAEIARTEAAVPISEQYFDHFIPLQRIQYLKLTMPTYPDDVYIGNMYRPPQGDFAELQLYGEGYNPDVTITSPPLDLGRSVNLTSVSWVGSVPPGTSIDIQTRTGDVMRDTTYYYNKNGEQITQLQWNKLPSILRGKTRTEQVEGNDWSGWSPIYETPGERFRSPNPRRFLKVRANLRSLEPLLYPVLDSVTLSYADRIAKAAIGEVHPNQALAGTPTTFVCSISATFDARDSLSQGFDRVGIATPEEARFLSATMDGALAAGVRGETGPGGLVVVFPALVKRSSLIGVEFETVLHNAGQFQARLQKGISGGQQLVDPGDATDRIESETMTVTLATGGSLVQNVSISPAIITPNGDGQSDQATASFDVLRLDRPRPAHVAVYDARGRLVKTLLNSRVTNGRHSAVWNGTDGGGCIVVPGVYVCRIEVETDKVADIRHELIGVVY